jgi:phage portal protein BeeE
MGVGVAVGQRMRGAWSAVREVVRAQPSAAVVAAAQAYAYGFSYGTPNAERVEPTFAQFAQLGYGGNSIVFGLINKRLKLFSEARFKYRNLADKRLFGGPGLFPLEKPWPNGSTGDLLARMEQDASLAGNAYVRDAGERLERLRPDWVTIISLIKVDELGRSYREVVGYLYDPVEDGERGIEFYPVDEVAHWAPIPDPLANFRGMSWLTPVLREINADTQMTQHRDSYFRNAATPNLILKYAIKLSTQQKADLRDAVAAGHAGPDNAFSTMVLDEGADPMIVGAQLTEVFAAVQAAGENRIAVASGVPAIVAGLKEGLAASTLANYDSAVRAFADLEMRPNWRSACAALESLVTVPAGAELWFDTSDVAALQPALKDAADAFGVDASTAASLVQTGYTPDSVVTALHARDMSLLKHTGLFSVQLQPPGTTTPTGQPPTAGEPTDGRNRRPAVSGDPKARPALAARAFNPNEPRDPRNGKWIDAPGAGGAGGDVLKLAGRIRLGQDERLVSSDMLSAAPDASYPNRLMLANLSTPDGPILRMGMVDRDDASKWTAANKGATVQLDYLARVKLRGELETATKIGARASAQWRKDQAQYLEIKKRLAELDLHRDRKTGQIAASDRAEYERLVATLDSFAMGPDDTVYEGEVQGGPWGDLVVRANLDEESASGAFQVVLYRRPPDAGPNWTPDDAQFAMTAPIVRRLRIRIGDLQARAKRS